MVTGDLSTQLMVVVMPYCNSGHVTVIIRQRLFLSGDVELNPGPLDQGRLSIVCNINVHQHYIIIIQCHELLIARLSHRIFLIFVADDHRPIYL